MVSYQLVGDLELKVAKLYDMLPEEAGDSSEGRTAADNAPVRAVFVIGPDMKIKAMLTYSMTTGRNFDAVLRLLDSLQLTTQQPVATPLNWNPGDDVIIVPSVSDEQARKKFPGAWKAPKPYLRIVPPVFSSRWNPIAWLPPTHLCEVVLPSARERRMKRLRHQAPGPERVWDSPCRADMSPVQSGPKMRRAHDRVRTA